MSRGAGIALTIEYIGIAAVIFDRDGVLIEDTGYPHRAEHLRWMPGALEALRWLRERGILALIATNQSGVARGYFSEKDVEAFHLLMQQQIVANGGRIEAFAVCPHLPDAVMSQYRLDCGCRKPRPGLVQALLQRFALDPATALMIGDRDRDVQAGEAAGVRSFLYPGGDLLGFVQDAIARMVRGDSPRSRLCIAGFGMLPVAGITEARITHPLEEMRWLGDNHIVHGAGELAIPENGRDVVIILHRQFMTNPRSNAQMEDLCRRGWVLVLEMDDDPRRWPEFVESDFFAFRCVHGVSVSTPTLADLVRAWNPEVAVFPNAIHRLPEAAVRSPDPNKPLRVFFGAINRENDWAPIAPALREALESTDLGERVRFVVLHDAAFARAFGPWVAEAHPMVPLDAYYQHLASCDVALLPLMDTPFNRMKSDLKLIECLAQSVVPICSSVVYAERAEHVALAWFADSPQQWVSSLRAACDDRAGLNMIRSRGRPYLMRERMQWQQAPARDAWYRSLLSRREAIDASRRARLARLAPRG
jgi:histidinol-phosphate phosphatase family protein